MTVEDALVAIGPFGKWQKIHFFLLSIASNFPLVWQLFAPFLYTHVPQHRCKIESNETADDVIPKENSCNGRSSFVQCHRLDPLNGTRQPCPDGWKYEDFGIETITTQWDLVCSKGILPDISFAFFYFGVIVGVIILLPLADRFGRRPVYFIGHLGAGVLGALLSFIPIFPVFCLIHFFVGAFNGVAYIIHFILLVELFPSEPRVFLTSCSCLFAPVALTLLALLAFLIGTWKYVQLLISLCSLVCCIYFFWCPESAAWLKSHGEVRKTKRLLIMAGRMNGRYLPKGLIEQPHHKDHRYPDDKHRQHHHPPQDPKERHERRSDDKHNDLDRHHHQDHRHLDKKHADNQLAHGTHNYHDDYSTVPYKSVLKSFFKRYRCKKCLFIMTFTIFCSSWTYFGSWHLQLWSLTTIGLLDFGINAVVEIPMLIVAIYLVNRYGRRRPFAAFQVLSALFVAISGLFSPYTFSSVVCSFLSRAAISSVYRLIFFYGAEIAPTKIRCSIMAIAVSVGMLGPMLSPILTSFLPRETSVQPAPFLAVSAALSALGVLFLPETAFRTLPNAPEDVERWKVRLTAEERDKRRATGFRPMFRGRIYPMPTDKDGRRVQGAGEDEYYR